MKGSAFLKGLISSTPIPSPATILTEKKPKIQLDPGVTVNLSMIIGYGFLVFLFVGASGPISEFQESALAPSL